MLICFCRFFLSTPRGLP